MKIDFIKNNKTLVAIPMYNAENEISETIQSCINQKTKPDILIIDNCSSDNSYQIAKNFKDLNENIYLLKNDINVGRVNNWNKCLEIFYKSHHKYIRFLFTGDTYESNCIEKTEDIFEKHNDIAILISAYYFHRSNRSIAISKKNIPEGKYDLEDMIKKKLYPSRFSGTLLSNCFNKTKMNNIYFDENYHGTATFTNEIIKNGHLYYSNEKLCSFKQQHRKHFYKDSYYLINIERLFTAFLAIEKLNEFEKYHSFMKRNAIKNFLIYLLKYKFLPSRILFNLAKIIHRLLNK